MSDSDGETAADRIGDGDDQGTDDSATAGGRTVTVPVGAYKRITVFSTLVATVLVVAGFTMFDAAAFENSIVRVAVTDLLRVLGVAPDGELVTVAFVLLGLGLIALGAGSYVVGARFRAPDMGGDGPDGKG